MQPGIQGFASIGVFVKRTAVFFFIVLLFQNCGDSGFKSSGSVSSLASNSASFSSSPTSGALSPSPGVIPVTPPSITGTTYYVSPSGSDSNSGTSQSAPWKSISKINSSTFKAGDGILFQGGGSFAGCMLLTGSNVTGTSRTKGLVVSSYGSGSPTLTANCTGGQSSGIEVNGISGLSISNLTLRGAGGSTGTSYGIFLHNTSGGQISNISISNNDIGNFTSTAYSVYAAEIFITGDGAMDTIYVGNNTLHGLNGPSSQDSNGISGWGSNENVTNVTYERNMIYDLGAKDGYGGSEGNGILVGGVDGALVQYNVTHDIGGNLLNSCGGPSGIMTQQANNVTLQYNEAYNVQPLNFQSGCDWDGFDFDGGTTNSVMQYNYAHNNFGGGIITWMGSVNGHSWDNNTLRYNIAVNNGAYNNYNSSAGFADIALGGPWISGPTTANVYVYNNTAYNSISTAPVFAFAGTYPSGGFFANNILYSNVSGTSKIIGVYPAMNISGFKFINNDYYGAGQLQFFWNGTTYNSLSAWQSGTGQDSSALSVNPQLSSPGAGTACGGYTTSCPAGDMLASSSPMIGKGLNLSSTPYSQSVGSSDFYGIKLGTSFNIGAE